MIIFPSKRSKYISDHRSSRLTKKTMPNSSAAEYSTANKNSQPTGLCEHTFQPKECGPWDWAQGLASHEWDWVNKSSTSQVSQQGKATCYVYRPLTQTMG
jgi:hypothetical protein